MLALKLVFGTIQTNIDADFLKFTKYVSSNNVKSNITGVVSQNTKTIPRPTQIIIFLELVQTGIICLYVHP